MEDRFNTPHTSVIEIELLGHKLFIAQDPNSKHLGTTVWDSSLVFAKFLEKNSKKGEFSRVKLSGKRVIELGAGCGLAGIAMALLGCNVVATDQVEVLPMLLRNVERNMSRAKYVASDQPYLGPIGNVEVAELDWGNEQHIAAVEPPFDYIIGTDVVYTEHLLEPLVETMLSLAGPKSTVLLGYEFRSSGVREKLEELCQKHFHVKKVLHAKMDAKYQHPNIDLFILRRISTQGSGAVPHPDEGGKVATQPGSKLLEHIADSPRFVSQQEQTQQEDVCVGVEEASSEEECYEAKQPLLENYGSTPYLPLTQSIDQGSDWEVRRLGSAVARLLSGINIPHN